MLNLKCSEDCHSHMRNQSRQQSLAPESDPGHQGWARENIGYWIGRGIRSWAGNSGNAGNNGRAGQSETQ